MVWRSASTTPCAKRPVCPCVSNSSSPAACRAARAKPCGLSTGVHVLEGALHWGQCGVGREFDRSGDLVLGSPGELLLFSLVEQTVVLEIARKAWDGVE